jgi:Fur family ferric uptake transcriptional regulator
MLQPQAVFADYLARRKLKMTPQRKIILDVFLCESGHLGPQELYDKVKRLDKTIGQATVYRTLKLFSESGLAKEVNFGDGVTRYELKYGSEHHDHLVCERCGATVEVVDPKIEHCQEELAAAHGYTLSSHKMYLYGICPECRKGKG